MDDNKHYIAVYGTLKRGRRNHDYLFGAKFIKTSSTGPGYALFIDFLPFLIRREDGEGAEIEIYEVDSELLSRIDSLEGHPDLYSRELLRIEDEKRIEIYIYKSFHSKYSKTPIDKASTSY